jgi:hypothetical protein
MTDTELVDRIDGLRRELQAMKGSAETGTADLFEFGVYLLDHLPNLIGALTMLRDYIATEEA